MQTKINIVLEFYKVLAIMAQQARSSLLAVLLFFFSLQTVRASNSLLAPVTIYSSNLQQNTVNYQVGIQTNLTIPSHRPDSPHLTQHFL